MFDEAPAIIFPAFADLYAFAHLPISVAKRVQSRFHLTLDLRNTLDILNGLDGFQSAVGCIILSTHTEIVKSANLRRFHAFVNVSTCSNKFDVGTATRPSVAAT